VYIVQRQKSDINREFEMSVNLSRRTTRYAEELCELAFRSTAFPLRDVCHNARAGRTQLRSKFVTLTGWQLVREAISLAPQGSRFLPDGQLVVRLPEGGWYHSRILARAVVSGIIATLRPVLFSRTPLASGLWPLARDI